MKIKDEKVYLTKQETRALISYINRCKLALRKNGIKVYPISGGLGFGRGNELLDKLAEMAGYKVV